MKLLLLTSSLQGTAAHHLPRILESGVASDVLVVYSQGEVADGWSFFRRKMKKLLKVGVLGAINGRRMRQWYGPDVLRYTAIPRLDAYCRMHNVPWVQVPRINCEECVEAFRAFAPSVAVSLGNGYIESKVFSIPKHGMLNVHHEVLPDYRNAQSVLWQLYNGSDETGYTIHRIANRIDAGAIVYQKRIRICFGESLAATVSATVAALYEASAEGLVTVLSDLTGYLERAQVQGAGQTYTTPTAKQMQKIRSEWARLRCRLS